MSIAATNPDGSPPHGSAAQRLVADAAALAGSDFEALVESVPQLLWVADAAGNVIYYNQRVTAYSGIQPGRSGAWEWADALHPDDLRRTQEAWAQVTATGEPYEIEHRIRRLDGAYRWHLTRAMPARDHLGRVTRWFGTSTDVQDQRQHRQALQESLERERQRAEEMRKVIDAVPAAVWIARDPQCLTITGSRAAHDMLRMGDGSNLSKTAPEHERPVHFRVLRLDGREFAPDELPMQRAAATGEPQRGVRFDLAFSDGDRTCVYGNAEPLFDDHGKPRGAVSAFVDITNLVRAEEALRERERQLALVMNTAPVLIAHCDRDCRFQFANEAYARRFGLTVAQVVGRSVREVVGESAFATVHPHIQRVLAGEEMHFETEVNLPVLGRRHMQARYAPEIDAEGQVRGFVAVINDITERKRAEQQMQQARDEAQLRAREAEESQRLLSAMMEHIPMGITIADAPDVRIRTVSRHGRELVQRGRAEIEDIPVEMHVERWQVFHPDGVTPAKAEELPLTRAVQQGEVVREEEWLMLRPDGSALPILCNAAPIVDEQGTITGGVIGWQDITDRKRQEQLLRHSEERFREIFENAAVGIALSDPDGRFLRVNDSFLTMLGYEASDLIGRSYEHITHADDIEAARSEFARLQRGERDRYAMRKRYLRKDGGEVWVQLSVSARRDEQGRVLHVIRAAQDITAQVEAERQLQEVNLQLESRVEQRTQVIREQAEQVRELAMELIDAEERERKRIAAVLHDELQQLLAAGRMRLSMLRPHVPAQHHGQWSGIDELLDQSIAAARTLAVELSPPILRDAGLVPALGWLSSRVAEQHHLVVHVHAAHDAEPDSDNVRSFLFRAARELLFNVVKHAGTGEATLKLEKVEEQIHLTVSDTGRGIQSSGDGTGTGLGLFGLTQRAKRLGGWSRVDSTPGGGCQVTLAVPSAADGSASPPLAASLVESAAGTLPAPTDDDDDDLRVVVVDDHKLVREGLVHLLSEQSGMQVVGQADDGQHALAIVRELRPDVVLMDISMPRLDGIETTRQLKAEMPNLRIIGMSMHESDEMAEAMRSAGATSYVRKGGPAHLLLRAMLP